MLMTSLPRPTMDVTFAHKFISQIYLKRVPRILLKGVLRSVGGPFNITGSRRIDVGAPTTCLLFPPAPTRLLAPLPVLETRIRRAAVQLT